MLTIYLICAALGGTLLACQFVLSLLGLGGDHADMDHGGDVDHGDVDHSGDQDDGHGHDGTWFVGFLTLRTLTAALTFFGLAGLAANHQQMPPTISLLVALAAGGGAMFVVGWLMRSLHHLKDDGTVRIERAVGRAATVYLRVPAAKAGTGKVTVSVQNRTMEYQAVTAQEELPTGAKVVVVAVIGPDTVEVAPAPPI